MNNIIDWDDIKVFLETANTGSLTQAALKLNKSQPTIGRRIEKLETNLGLNLFVRSPYGYDLSPTGKLLLSKAQNISKQVEDFISEAISLQTNVSTKTVIITCGESFVSLLTAYMHEFMSQYPEISLDIISCFEIINIDKGEADIAIRAQRPDNPNLITKKLGCCRYAIYASQNYLSNNPLAMEPLNSENNLNWISYKDDKAELHSSKWLAANVNPDNIKLRCNTASSLLTGVKNHQGLAVLPQFVADKEKDLIQLSTTLNELQPDIWLVLNRNARRDSTITEVSNWINEIFDKAGFN